MYKFIIQNIVLIVVGLLLIVYGSLNATMSFAPKNIRDIEQEYGKTFALPVTTYTDNPKKSDDEIRKTADNAATLVILSIISGIFIIINSSYEIVFELPKHWCKK